MTKITDGHTCRTFLVKKTAGRRWRCGGCGALWVCKQTTRTTILGRKITDLYWLMTKSGKL
jgi:hypothetical protein